MTRSGWTGRRAALLLVAAVVLAWIPALDAPFTYDDRIEVVGNRTLRFLGEVGAIAGYNTSRPLLIATYAVDWRLWGLEPTGYHVVSLAIHALNAVLALRLLRRFLPPERAALGAALWAVHPMCTEAVTYVAGRSDALCATFWLLALGSWIDACRGGPGRARATLATIAATVAALLTKETAVALPFALLAADAFVARPGKVRWRAYAPFVGLLAAAGALRLATYGWPAPEVARSALAHVAGQAEAWVGYAQLWLFPYGQSILHDHPAQAHPAALLALAGWVAALVLGVRAGGVFGFAAALWSLSLLPASVVPLKETMAEHRAYLAGLAPALLLAARLPPATARAAWGLVPVLLVATALRNRVWTDEAALWGDAAAKHPHSADAWYAYGDALRLGRRHAEAEAAYRRSMEADPARADTRLNLGIARVERGDAEGARALWEDLLRDDPRNCAAHNNLAGLDAREGRLREAVAGYTDTLAWCPDDALAHLNLGNLHAALGDARKAALHYDAYLDVAPSGPGAETARQALTRLGGR